MVWVFRRANHAHMPEAAYPLCLEPEHRGVPSLGLCALHKQEVNFLMGFEVPSLQ